MVVDNNLLLLLHINKDIIFSFNTTENEKRDRKKNNNSVVKKNAEVKYPITEHPRGFLWTFQQYPHYYPAKCRMEIEERKIL